MGNKKKAYLRSIQSHRKEGAAHVHFKFNSQTFRRLRATFQEMCSSREDEIFRNKDISIKLTSKGSLDAALKFELCEIEKGLKGKVTMHLYSGTTSLMVQGNSGRILNKPPFRCFADIYLEPLIAGEDMALAQRDYAQETSDLLKELNVRKQQEEKKRMKEKQESKVKEWSKVRSCEESNNSNLVKFMERQIKELEEELECPVCMEIATTAPIYKCPEDHLICRICRPKLSECPQCRVALKGLSYVKFRGAERQAGRLLALKKEKLDISKDDQMSAVPKEKPAQKAPKTEAKNSPQQGNRSEDLPVMAPTVNNWGSGYGEKTTNMNNMERDNGGSGMQGVNQMQQKQSMKNGSGSTNAETLLQTQSRMQMIGGAAGAGGEFSMMGGGYVGGDNFGRVNMAWGYMGGGHARMVNMGGANMGGANMGRANIGGANMGWGNIGQVNIVGGVNMGRGSIGGVDIGGVNMGGDSMRGGEIGGGVNHVVAQPLLFGPFPYPSIPYPYGAVGGSYDGRY